MIISAMRRMRSITRWELFISQPEINIIDLGLIAPNGMQVGASGSDKKEFFVTEINATPGYNPTKLVAGEWMIMVGAYKVAPQGCHVVYEIELYDKEESYLKGDLHTHTLGIRWGLYGGRN